mmetsp:Transcript_5514/g.14950  ORF Transcript_5514/g.14950 Transcript_5514/m.14950 type:complete len:366 (-) Transcript_5514:177-1274(-)
MGLLMVDFSSQPPPLFSFSLSFPASAPPGRSGVGPCSRSLAGMDGGVASAARVRCAPARLALSFLVSSLSSTASVPESWAKIVAIFSVRARMSSRLGGASSMVSVVSSWLWRSTGETVRRSCAGARGAPGTMGRACSATAGAASGIPGTSGRASRATAGGASSALGSPSGSAEISAPPAARSGASAPAPCSGGGGRRSCTPSPYGGRHRRRRRVLDDSPETPTRRSRSRSGSRLRASSPPCRSPPLPEAVRRRVMSRDHVASPTGPLRSPCGRRGCPRWGYSPAPTRSRSPRRRRIRGKSPDPVHDGPLMTPVCSRRADHGTPLAWPMAQLMAAAACSSNSRECLGCSDTPVRAGRRRMRSKSPG